MSQAQLDSIIDGFGRLYAGWGHDTGIADMRSQWEAFLAAPHAEAVTADIDADGVACRWVVAPGAGPAAYGHPHADTKGDGVILFLHGGGYQIGSTASHHNAMARLSASSGCRVLGVDYRRAPEHRFPAPVEDALAAWHWLLGQGFAAGRIALCGDSAGGGLALALLVSLRDTGLPLPAAAVLMSPWADMEASGASYATHAARDPVTQRAVIQRMARAYMGKGVDLRHPLASPLHAELAGLPPVLVQVGEREVLLDDATGLADRLRQAGGDVRLAIWQGMVHTFQLFTGRLDEADAALDEAALFLRSAFPSPQDTTP
ncbi:MAG: alpha/beta hydrolase [Pseudomonadota bacterium]